jgi:hypothetical protein
LRIVRAWIDIAADDWRHEANSYGSDDEDHPEASGLWFHDEPRGDDTAEIEVPIYLPEQDGDQD